MTRPRTSVIIPTYNRRGPVVRALESVMAQTLPVEEVVVVDDGSSDGTAEAIRSRFGSRVVYVWQENAGVSAARNRGLATAQGAYLSFLDSDDEWLPEKHTRQVSWLDAHPDFGMVVCDVVRVGPGGRQVDVVKRRDAIQEDGPALRWVLRNPSLVTSSPMFRREVYETVGGFDAGLPTAEDIDFHLRVARAWPIGVISEQLVRVWLGSEGLSALGRSYDDYQRVMERFAERCRGEVPDRDLDAGLAYACVRNARGLLLAGRWREARQLIRRGLHLAPESAVWRDAILLVPLALRRGLRGILVGQGSGPAATS